MSTIIFEESQNWEIYFKDFPLPPTVNKAYVNFGINRRRSSKSLLDFKKAAHEWAMLNNKIVKYAQGYIANTLREDQLIKIDAWVGLKYSRLFTLKNIRKNIDVTNRIKALHDSLSKILMFDDRYFCTGHTEPVIVENKESECVLIKLSITEMKILEDLVNPEIFQMTH